MPDIIYYTFLLGKLDSCSTYRLGDGPLSVELVAVIVLGCLLIVFHVVCGICIWWRCIRWRCPTGKPKEESPPADHHTVLDFITVAEPNLYEKTLDGKSTAKHSTESEAKCNGDPSAEVDQKENLCDNTAINFPNHNQRSSEVKKGFRESPTDVIDHSDWSSISDVERLDEEDSATNAPPPVRTTTGNDQNQSGEPYSNGMARSYPYTKTGGGPGGKTAPNQLAHSNGDYPYTIPNGRSGGKTAQNQLAHSNGDYPYTIPDGRPGGKTAPNQLAHSNGDNPYPIPGGCPGGTTDGIKQKVQVQKNDCPIQWSYPYSKPAPGGGKSGRTGNQI